MFIKYAWRTVNGKQYKYPALVESIRENGKTRHKVICNLAKFPENVVENLKISLKNKNATLIEDPDDVFEAGFDFGDMAFFLGIMKELGLFDAVSSLSPTTRAKALGMIQGRILNPGSKRATVSWLKRTAFPLLTGLDEAEYNESRFYEGMDELHESLEDVMERFYKLSGNAPAMLLYDITSTYFEGAGSESARFGYSRDHRSDLPQILLALCVNEHGFPIHFEMFEGNIQDKSTVLPVIKRVKERFEIEKGVFIGDRGMISSDNVEGLLEMGLGYILALRHGEARELLDREQSLQMELFDRPLPLRLTNESRDVKYVLCGSKYRKANDELKFARLLEKGEMALGQVRSMVERGLLKDREKVIRRAQKGLTESGTEKYFDFRYEENGRFTILRKEEEIRKSMALCGHYILKTTEVDLPEEEVEARYKKLQDVERIFRDLKDFLEIRPIFHWKDRRVKTHVFMCLIAQAVLGRVKAVLKSAGWFSTGRTMADSMNTLAGIKLGRIRLGENSFLKVQKLDREQKELLELFSMDNLAFDSLKSALSL